MFNSKHLIVYLEVASALIGASSNRGRQILKLRNGGGGGAVECKLQSSTGSLIANVN